MKRLRSRSSSIVLIGALTLAILTGCSQVQLAYGMADLLIKREVDSYLGLDSAQITRWEPRLEAALEEHRATELPHLAGFFDALHLASTRGFDQDNTRCLIAAFRALYLRHARLAVELAAPLLAGLTATQVAALERRFAAEYAEDRITPGSRNVALEARKRANRYAKSIEEWTGPLTAAQRTVVADVTGRMPDTTEAVLAYRTHKREELVALLRRGASEAEVKRFLTDWLVDYRDLPPTLAAAGGQIGERVGELLIRLGATLDQSQRKRLNERLLDLRGDLMRLQRVPRMVPVGCPA